MSKIDDIRALGQPEIARQYAKAKARAAALPKSVTEIRKAVTEIEQRVTKPKSGRPKKASALTPAEKQRAYRDRRKGK